jgi:hypothetical protein
MISGALGLPHHCHGAALEVTLTLRRPCKLLDAVYELFRERPGVGSNPVFRDIADLRDKVERPKREAAAERIDQLRDLELLKASDKPAFDFLCDHGGLSAI